MKFLTACLLALLVSTLTPQAHEKDKAAPSGDVIRVLAYSDTAYYRHPEIPAINRWLVLLGHENGIEVDISEHPRDLQPDVLKRYDVLLLNNANQLDKVVPEEQRKSVEAWFTKGKKGIVGLHAALVKQQGWPWLTELGGCDFNSDSDYLEAKVSIDPAAKNFPGLEGQPAEFTIKADWTNHDLSVSGLPGFSVLMRVDETSYDPVRNYFKTRNGKAMGKDHPISWINEPRSGGRFFYTEFGHDLRSLETPFVRKHILGGIRWAAGMKTKVVCFGDSITKRGYPDLLAKQLKVEAVNAGVAGHSSAAGLRRMQKDVIEQNPDVVVIFFGTSDARVDSERVHVPVTKYEANLNKMVERCEKIGAAAVICTPPPIDSAAYFQRHDRKIYDAAGGLEALCQQYREAALRVAKKHKIPVVDLNQKLLKHPDWLHKDGVHPSPAGNLTIAELISEAVEPLLKQ